MSTKRQRRPGLRSIALWAAAGLCLLLGCLRLGWGLLNNRFLDRINAEIASQAATPQQRVLATFALVADWERLDFGRLGSPLERWMAHWEHASPLRLSTRTVLTAGVDPRGPCGSVSRSLVVLLRRAGLEARKAILYGPDDKPQHTVVEVFLDGEWRVLDPTYRWYWTRPRDGGMATAADLRDRELLGAILATRPDYPLDIYNYDNVYHLRWEKLPGLGWLRTRLLGVRGGAWVRAVPTPAIYERPAFLSGSILTGVGVVLAGLGFLQRRRRSPAA